MKVKQKPPSDYNFIDDEVQDRFVFQCTTTTDFEVNTT